jgi:hypothetical protein
MRARGQANNEDTRMRVTKSGDRPAPINLVTVGPTLFKSHLLTPLNQAGTASTLQELCVELLQGHEQILPHKALEIPQNCVTLTMYCVTISRV